MTLRIALLSLLVLLSAWAESLRGSPFLRQSVRATPVERQVAYPLALRVRAELRDKMEQKPPATLGSPGTNQTRETSRLVSSGLEEKLPRILATSDACYLLMSLRW